MNQEHKDSLVISQKELYYGLAALFCAAIFIFVSGYFLGKKRVLEDLAAQYDDECFADKVYQSFAALTDSSAESSNGESTGSEQAEQSDEEGAEQAADAPAMGPAQEVSGATAYAQLCGFGTKQAAELYVDRLKRRAIPATIVDRKSRSKRGRMVTWYQVVTQTMNRQELEELLQKIKKDDKLTSIQIVDVSSSDTDKEGHAS